jgi:hypothetical protein
MENENISNRLFLDSYEQYTSEKRGGPRRRMGGSEREMPRFEKRKTFLSSHLAINHDLKAALITKKIEIDPSCMGFDIDERLVIEYYYKKA